MAKAQTVVAVMTEAQTVVVRALEGGGAARAVERAKAARAVEGADAASGRR